MKSMICRHCGTENPANSKFCNNCGGSLRPPTTQICPNCKAPNPNNLLYCDRCGTRLPGNELVEDEPERKDPSPGAQTPEPFTLPSRPAGKTGNLDWAEGVPDWLKTGESGETRTGQPEEPHPGDDLPTWLLDEDTGHAFFDDERTTDELFGKTSTAADDEGEPGGEGLPEWLSGLAPSGTGPLPSGGRPSGGINKPSLNDWLADLGEADDADQIPSWMETGAEELATTAPEDGWPAELQGGFEGSSDWLTDLDVGDSPAPDAEAGDEPWSEPAQSGFDVDDWLAELESIEQEPEQQKPTSSTTADDLEDQAIPDWLAGSQQQAPPPVEPQFDALEAIPDWLADLEAEGGRDDAIAAEARGEAAVEPVSGLPEAPAGDLDWHASQSGDVGDDWLDTLEDEWRKEGNVSDQAEVPPWLAAASAGVFAGPEMGEELPQWLEEGEPPAESAPGGERAAESSRPGGEETAAADGPVAPELDWWPAGEEAPDWLMVTEPEDAGQPAPAPTEDPDWLSELDAAIGELEAASQEGSATGLGPDQEISTGPGDEFEEPLPTEAADEEELLPSWLSTTELRAQAEEIAFEPAGELAVEPDAGDEADADSEYGDAVEEAPDWLGDLQATDSGTGPLEEMDLPDWLQEAAPLEPAVEAAPAGGERAAEEFAFVDMPGVEGEDEALPDWLVEVTTASAGELFAMTSPEEQEQPAEEDSWLSREESERAGAELAEILGQEAGDEVVAADELPDWLGDVVDADGAELSAYLDDTANVPNVLAGPHLPQWLDDSLPDNEIAEPTPLEDLPSWLTPPVGAGAQERQPSPEIEASGEWADVLGELAESDESGGDLSAAEIPEWLQALKPQAQLRDDAASAEEAQPATEGPLAGLRGVVGVVPVISVPRSAEYAGRFEVSKEQQEQAELLRQLVRLEAPESPRVLTREQARPSPWLRVVLSLLLLAAVFAGLFLPDLVEVKTAPVMPVTAVSDVLQTAADQPVLVVFDYTPAYAGILNDQASILLQALAAQGSLVIYASQSAAGLGLGTSAIGEIAGLEEERLGYIPGETMGLRRLAGCLEAGDCDSYPPATGDVAAILLLTGERDSLVDWVEQVEAVSPVPLVAGVTESLAPVAAPYEATGQLDAVLVGHAGTAALADAAGIDHTVLPATPLALATWLVAALLLAGNVVFLLASLAGTRRTKSS